MSSVCILKVANQLLDVAGGIGSFMLRCNKYDEENNFSKVSWFLQYSVQSIRVNYCQNATREDCWEVLSMQISL